MEVAEEGAGGDKGYDNRDYHVIVSLMWRHNRYWDLKMSEDCLYRQPLDRYHQCPVDVDCHQFRL